MRESKSFKSETEALNQVIDWVKAGRAVFIYSMLNNGIALFIVTGVSSN